MTVKLAVRQVVELVMRSGDIDNRFVDVSNSMRNGSKAHKMIQKSYSDAYISEVFLRLNTKIDDIDVVLEGRADGVIIDENGKITVDEIKTTTFPLEKLSNFAEQHLAQAICYAHMLLTATDLPARLAETVAEKKLMLTQIDRIDVQLTYYHLETGETVKQHQSVSREALRVFFEELLRKYGVWMRYEQNWKLLRDKTIKEMHFPFPAYRRGQRELAVSVYRTVARGGKLYAEAPTGIGKTISVLFPAIKAMAEDKAEKLFYLTAKTVTRSVAENTVRHMVEQGLRFKSVTLRAKEKICFMQETICNPDYCDCAKGHYDRIGDALLDLLHHNDIITPEDIVMYARKHRVCPHEMGLDAALWVDLVIGDYNHVFDPEVYLKRFFYEVSGDYVFLIDEAHNLVDRVREMYTAVLRKSAFYRLKKKLKDKNPEAALLRSAMGAINQYMLNLRKALEAEHKTSEVTYRQDTGLEELIVHFLAACGEWLSREKLTSHPLQAEVLELYFDTLSFNRISGGYSSCYCCIAEANGSEVEITYFCLNPSEIAAGCLTRAKASVMFSATLTPLFYYREILGGDRYDDILTLPSPFEQERLKLIAHQGISTKYRDREASIGTIADAIAACVTRKKGNYLVFFPSFAYLSKVYAFFSIRYPDIKTVLQQNSMSDNERAAFINLFDAENAETLAGFCVLGGIFAEGIDLRGERLIGSIIVGVGLPKLSLRQNLIRDYFNSINGQGYDYAYAFPGMNKVLQAAGRVIRTESDNGLVVLIDSRFGTEKYRRLFPEHWSHIRFIKNNGELKQLLMCVDRRIETTDV
ncbi:MAG: ATP-dependent DNA helicase [Clostridiales bacterium]|nr:ATP-dependent DNA helicase [Clostridiales bacterium]